jgi:hypothetical protein
MNRKNEPHDYGVYITEAQRQIKELEKACLKSCVEDAIEGYDAAYNAAANLSISVRMVLEWAAGKATALRMTERR